MQFPLGCFLESDHTANPGSRLLPARKALGCMEAGRGPQQPPAIMGAQAACGGGAGRAWHREVSLSAGKLPLPLSTTSLTKGHSNTAFGNPFIKSSPLFLSAYYMSGTTEQR